MESNFNLLYIIDIIRKYFRYIAIVVVISVILAIILTMPAIYAPQYASQTIVYPMNPERYDMINAISEKDKDLYVYGGPKDVEKLANLAKSETIALFVIDSLDLWKAYGIDKKSNNSPKFKVLKNFRGNVTITQVEGAGVSIEAYDEVPQRAADIVNLIVFKLNRMGKESLEKNRNQLLNLYQKNYEQIDVIYRSYIDSSRKARTKYQIYSYDAQTREMVGQMLKVKGKYENEKARFDLLQKKGASDTSIANARLRVKGAESELKSLQGVGEYAEAGNMNIENFQSGVDKVIQLEQNFFQWGEKLRFLKAKIESAKAMTSIDYDTVLTLEPATASDKKARPVRWVIIATSFLLSLIVSIVAALLIELGLPLLFSKQ